MLLASVNIPLDLRVSLTGILEAGGELFLDLLLATFSLAPLRLLVLDRSVSTPLSSVC